MRSAVSDCHKMRFYLLVWYDQSVLCGVITEKGLSLHNARFEGLLPSTRQLGLPLLFCVGGARNPTCLVLLIKCSCLLPGLFAIFLLAHEVAPLIFLLAVGNFIGGPHTSPNPWTTTSRAQSITLEEERVGGGGLGLSSLTVKRRTTGWVSFTRPSR
jgi:hypothetical protein